MAKLYKNVSNNIDYYVINYEELVLYNKLIDSVCDECLKLLKNSKDEKIILIPILNEAFCYKCGIEKVRKMKDYPEEKDIQKRRTYFCMEFFKKIGTYEGRDKHE